MGKFEQLFNSMKPLKNGKGFIHFSSVSTDMEKNELVGVVIMYNNKGEIIIPENDELLEKEFSI